MPFESARLCDLRIAENFDLKKLDVLSKLGYDTIAIDRELDESIFEKKKAKKGETPNDPDCIPEPVEIPDNLVSNLTVLHRLTFEFSEPSVLYKLSRSENLKKYDILAVVPTSAAAFQAACATFDTDIVSYKPETSSNFKINRKLYRQAVERGVHFEICYAPALGDSTRRKNIIQRAHLYNSVGKSANLILSSGARNEFQVRGPHDVVNLGLILALSEQQSRNILSVNAKKVLLKADSRRRGKVSIFALQKINSNKRPSVMLQEGSSNKKLKSAQ